MSGTEAYYGFWSYDRPMEIYRTSIAKGGNSLWYAPSVPFDNGRIVVELAAALQAATDGGPVLLRVDWQAGHFGEGSVTADTEKNAGMLAFALDGH